MNCVEAADYLVKNLKKVGFTIQRYDAYSTNSIYLKLDFGLSNSIRISDHEGKKHLSYRFNLIHSIAKSHVDESGKYPRYYYSFRNIDQLVEDVVNHRKAKLELYGLDSYQRLMKKNQRENGDNKGFWKKSVIV